MPQKENLKLLIDKKRIDNRLTELAGRISNDYKGKVPVFIGVLNGSFIFLSDLVRKVKLDVEIDFIKISSYRSNKTSSGKIRLLKELSSEITNRDIIVAEDIIDSGLSVKFIRNLLLRQKPASLEFATLLFKKGLSNLDFRIKYTGFKIPGKFVVGYGLDFAQKYRNLKEIYILKN